MVTAVPQELPCLSEWESCWLSGRQTIDPYSGSPCCVEYTSQYRHQLAESRWSGRKENTATKMKRKLTT